MRVLLIWLEFAACVAFIWAGGVRLSRYGDVIAEKTGMSRSWIGLILLATVTSLPELVTGVSAATLTQAPDIALGDVLGSCVFNLLILTIADFLYRGESVFSVASQGHILSAGFGIILIGFVGFSVTLNHQGLMPAIGHVGISSLIIVAIYAIAMRTVFRYERKQLAEYREEAVERYPKTSLRQAVTGYSLAALVVVATGTFLPFVGVDLAQVMGWKETFVGTLFIAFATSVPEIVVTIAAVRLDALDMAVGNLFGSNLFDILIVAIDDVVFVPGPILADVSTLHVVSSLSAVMMTGVAVVSLLYRPKTRVLRTVGWGALLLFSFYLLNSYVLFLYGG